MVVMGTRRDRLQTEEVPLANEAPPHVIFLHYKPIWGLGKANTQ